MSSKRLAELDAIADQNRARNEAEAREHARRFQEVEARQKQAAVDKMLAANQQAADAARAAMRGGRR